MSGIVFRIPILIFTLGLHPEKLLYILIPIHSAPNNLAHLRINLEDIESATNFFDEENVIEENVIGEGVSGKRYKGQLLWSGELIDINARRLINKEWDEKEQQFWTEISILSSLKHKNLVSILGFCNEVGAETIIYKVMPKRRLNDYLSDPVMLTWVKRLEISVGVAHALSYIHYDEPRDFSVIHGNISSHTILLNDDWEPILWKFQYSMKIKASERNHAFHTDSVWSTKGYTDPTYVETSSVNHQSDIYSFGMVLFELLCCRKSVIDDQDNKYLAPVAIFHYREKILDGIIDPDLWKQMNPQSFNIFAETAHDCLNEERLQRPNIDEIVKRLQKALELQRERQNAEHPIVATEVEGTSSTDEKGSVSFISTRVESHVSKKTMSSLKDLSYLNLSYKDIASATNNFADENILSKFRFGRIYEGRLLQSELDIIVKSIYSRYVEHESKKFWTEISMLSSLKHKNLVSLVGFCEEEGVKIIIYKKEANGNLKESLSDQSLTWTQRLKICVGVANALNYIHYDHGRDFSVIHCNINSLKILLDEKWEPKLSGFELSLKNTVARRHRLLLTPDNIIKNVYLDPKYKITRGVTHKSDVYSFGVVLFEVLCRRSAVLPDEELGEGLLSKLAKSHLEDMIDPELRKQMDPESFRIFSETAYYCIQEERAKRPHIDQVAKRLEKALELQWKRENPVERTSSNQFKGKNLEHLKIALNDIKEATNNFDNAYIIGSGGFGKVYKANLEHFDSISSSSIEGVNECDLPRKRSTVAIKRINNQEGEHGFIAEIETLTSCKHENIISLLGFCYQGDGAMILVYEHASKGSLESYLGSNHGKQKMLHRDIKSDNILLGDTWKAKIADFGLSNSQAEKRLTFYSNMFAEIAFRCVAETQAQRPTIEVVIKELKKALNSQEDYEKWEPKLPKDYKEIIQMSKCLEIYSTIKKEDLYNIFSKGILLQQDKVLLSFDGDRERNEMVSATMFSYIGSCPHESKSLPESRFGIAVEILDISNLNIEIKTRAKFLSPNVVYGVYLVFKFCDSRNFSSKPVYINLKYKKGTESLNAYFATWRDKEWMMIELYRFLNQNEDVVIEFILESFSSYYCGDSAIYVEGIEFQAIENVTHDNIGKFNEVPQVLKSNFSLGQLQQFPTKFKEIFKKYTNYDELFWLGNVNGKKFLMLSAKAAICKFSNVNLYSSRRSAHSRIRVLPSVQAFRKLPGNALSS
ncbi:kinase-like domain, phloem protein 2-like protein, partial [Tanacetum coccineum]